MKKAIKISLIMILCSAMAMPSVSAQNDAKSKSHMTKQEKKEMRMKASLESRKYIFQLLKHKLFVLEANQLYGRSGMMIPVSSSINFLAIKGNKIIFQFGLEGRMMGSNGLGGLTAEGFVDNYSFNPGKTTNKAMVVTGDIRPKGSGDQGHFVITVQNDGNAYLNILLPYGGRLTMNGQIVDFAHTSVFKGHTMF